MIRCLHCGAETSNGLALCDLCRGKAAVDLEFLPAYFRNLARWRPGRAGSRQVPGSREPGRMVSGGDRISRALDEIGTDLVGWAEALDDSRPGIRWPLDLADLSEGEQAVSLCLVFDEHLTSISTTDWCGEFVRALAGHEQRLRELTEDVAPGWYAGGCKRCGYATYVVPGLTWVTCRVCGTTTYARDHLAVVLDEARNWVAPPKRIAEAVVALVDTEQSVPRLHDRIRQWGQRDRIEALRRLDSDGDEVGPKRYRLGDVLDLLRAEGQTRPERVVAADAGTCAS